MTRRVRDDKTKNQIEIQCIELKLFVAKDTVINTFKMVW